MSLTTPIDQQIVDEIARLLARISTANGYRTEAGTLVLTEETRENVDPTDITLEILDETEQLDAQSRTYRRGKLTLSITATIPKGDSSRALARTVLADIRRALAVERRQPIDGLTGLEVGSRQLPMRTDGSQFITASLDVVATFNEAQPVSTPIHD